jgi:hypothetical protein
MLSRLPLVAICLLACAAPALAGREDRAARIDANTDRDIARAATRAEERAARDNVRAVEERDRSEIRAAEDATRAAEDAARDAAEAAEQAARDAADAAEEAAKDAADAADAAKDAADAAEDAAEDAARGEGAAGAATLYELAADEAPEMDSDGYPVRRGEVIALDLDRRVRTAAEARGFRIIETTRLNGLDSSMTRLAVPPGMSAGDAVALMRQIDTSGSYDLAHYYGAQLGTAGGNDGDPATDRVPAEASGLQITRSAQPIMPRLRVGMIDTTVAFHPQLLGVRLASRNFGSASPASDHGTAVASVLAGDGVGQIVSANVFRGEGDRQYTSPDAIVRALAWLVEQDVTVINISLAGPRNMVLDQLIARSQANGHIIVAAAGNGGPTAPPAYPAALPDVVAVTAVDSRGRVYRQANQGSYVRFSALGVAIAVAAPGGGTAPRTGTSFASPHVAAAIGRCTLRAGRAPAQCVGQLERQAIDLGSSGRDPVYGVGLIL